MINPIEGFIIVGIACVVALIIGVVLGLLYGTPKTTPERPQKGLLPPLHWGYKARTDGSGLKLHPNPPKAPKGRGGASS